jgi:hypothetical protein
VWADTYKHLRKLFSTVKALKSESPLLFNSAIQKEHRFLNVPVFACCSSGKSSMWMKMSMEHWCNDPDRGKENCSESLANATQVANGLV